MFWRKCNEKIIEWIKVADKAVMRHENNSVKLYIVYVYVDI